MSRITFGPFEVDLARAELRKHGLRIKLHEKSFRLLAVLLEKPGEIVSHEDIRRRLWPEDVYVDFDRNLYTTLNRLRLALGDSSDNPRFVETVHRRGYRFIAPVTTAEAPASPSPTEPRAPGPAPRKPASRGVRLSIAAALALLAVMVASLLYLSDRPRASQAANRLPVTVGVLLFENLTGDASQDYLSCGLTQEILVELTRLKPGAVSVKAWPPGGHFPAEAEQPSESHAGLVADYVVEGGVRRENDLIRVSVELVEVRTGRVLWAERFAHRSDQLPSSQEELARRIAEALSSELAALTPPAAPRRDYQP